MSGLPMILKRLRAERGVTQDQVGESIQVSGSLIAAFETSRLVPQPDTAERLDAFFGSGDQIQASSAEARKQGRPTAPWFRPWRQIEESASTLRYFDVSLIPGLLQTEAYARSVLDSGLRCAQEIEEQLAIRMERQSAVLDRDNPPACAFVLDAAVLRCGIAEVAKTQLTHLVEAGERPGVYVQVIPDTAGIHPGRSGAFALATLDTGGMAGYLEDFFEGRVLAEPARVTGLDRTWQSVSAVALPCDQSRDLILKMVDEL
ncbi:helix-turn-helix domain-containing protein [Plantactinospora sp. CA-290183]|uniref:helix-turn-helix domain-containing protein n=1 Tax=Plantactinospora sp. CA-290183 TaxID=3240006 RepID=UPI003D8A9F33